MCVTRICGQSVTRLKLARVVLLAPHENLYGGCASRLPSMVKLSEGKSINSRAQPLLI